VKNLTVCLVFAIVLLAAAFVAVPCWGRVNVDIGISTQAGWFGQGTADREMNEVVANVEKKVNDIQLFPPAKQNDLADWVEKHTSNNQLDVLILCGQFPSTIYQAGNGEPDGSLAEEFLEAGNMIANTGDYMFYVVNGAGTNAAGGLQNMMDIPGTSMWDDNTSVEVTDDGKKYLPTLKDFQTDRPFHLNELQDPWETEIIFAGDEMRADPVVVRDTDTDGRLAIFYQTASQDGDPRGEVISEFVLNWLPEIAGGGFAVGPKGKLGALWGRLKVSD
jgi:hypothetical protein